MTFSLVARDPDAGMWGIAVASHWPGVGGVVPYFRPRTGVVASQAIVLPALAEGLLDALAEGATPQMALSTALVGRQPELRQIIVLDPDGRGQIHTGTDCPGAVSEARGPGCWAAGNLLASPDIAKAMVAGFVAATGQDFPDRLHQALRAGEAAGGDRRGRQAATIQAWPLAYPNAPRLPFDLRVDDHPDPVAELARLIPLRRTIEGL